MVASTLKEAKRATKLVDKVNAVVLVEPNAEIVPLGDAIGDSIPDGK